MGRKYDGGRKHVDQLVCDISRQSSTVKRPSPFANVRHMARNTRRRRAPPRTRTFLLLLLLLTACVITGDGVATAASTVPGTWRLVTSWARPRGGALFVPFRRDLVLNSGSHGLPCPRLFFLLDTIYEVEDDEYWVDRLNRYLKA